MLSIFSEGAYLRPVTLVGCWYYNIFLGGALSFLRVCTFWLLFSLYFSLFCLSLSLIYFYWWFFASASETNGYSFTEFLLQQGKGRVCTGVGEGGIVNCGDVNNKDKTNELTTLLQRLKILAGAVILKDEGEYDTGEMRKIQWNNAPNR